MKTLTLLITLVSLSLASLANANDVFGGSDEPWGTNAPGYDPDAYFPPHSYRVFYLVEENGVVHGDQIDRDGVISADSDYIGNLINSGSFHPYHYSESSYSESLVWLKLLHDASKASVAIAEIEISDLDLDW